MGGGLPYLVKVCGGGGVVVGGGPVGERSAVADGALSPSALVLLSCLDAKSDKYKFFEQGCGGEFNYEEVESKWLKGGSLA